MVCGSWALRRFRWSGSGIGEVLGFPGDHQSRLPITMTDLQKLHQRVAEKPYVPDKVTSIPPHPKHKSV